MKRILLSVSLALLVQAAFAQAKPVKKPATKPVTKPVATTPVELKTLADSAAYAIGADVGQKLLAQNMHRINRSLVSRSLSDVLDGKPTLIDENACFLVLNDYSNKMMADSGKTKPAAQPVAKNNTAPLKTLADSAGYALGANIATSLKMQDLSDIKRALITCGMNDALDRKPTQIKKENYYQVISAFASARATEKSAAVIEEGRVFLEKNKQRPEVKTTASGLQYEVLRDGSGEKPAATDIVKVHYRGTLINGTEFDASYNRNQPIEFGLNQVIAGWTEGVQLMPAGSKYKFYIPYNLAYGLQGSPPVIPGGATLIFEVELLEFKKQ